MAFARRIALVWVLCAAAPAASPPRPELWYWHHSYLTSERAVASSKALIDRAVAAGYTGVAFWDSSFSFMSDSFWPRENVERLRAVLNYAAGKGLKIMAPLAPFGFANDPLQANPNWAEAQRIIGAQFQVDASGSHLDFVNSFPGLVNSGFEAGEANWFSTHDSDLALEAKVAHSGRASAVIRNARGNARLRQELALTPWRQYHLRLFFKTENFRGLSQLGILDAADTSKQRLNAPIAATGTHDWTQLDFTFNSQDSTRAWLYAGVWGGSSGTLWLDDVQIEETALVYVVRRSGAPLRVYDSAHPEIVYREGADYNAIADPRVASSRTPFTDLYRAPAPVTLPAGSRLRPGERVSIDFYAVFPIAGPVQVAMCLTEPGVLDWQRHNAEAVRDVLPRGGGILMQYDEIRQMNSCASCRGKHLTAAGLLDWSVAQSIEVYKSVFPDASLYIWSDMFDPAHNARDHYYLVEGDLTGSWNGLPRGVTILNWNPEHLRESLAFFAGRGHRQIIAGYYDRGDGAAAARAELAAAARIPQITGLMYTTWSHDYSQLGPFAAAAKSSWRNYTDAVAGFRFPGLLALLCGAVFVAVFGTVARRMLRRR